MPTIQIVLDQKTYAELAYLAGIMQRRKADIAMDLLKEAVSLKHREFISKPEINIKMNLPSAIQPTTIRRGRTGQAILYKGSDSRLRNGRIYKNYVEVLGILRPDLAKLHPDGLLYNSKTHHGDKAESILKRHTPEIYKDLVRQ